MAIHLADGELEVLAELQEWESAPDGPGDEDWCLGCGCPVGQCECPTLARLREEARADTYEVPALPVLRSMFAAAPPWGVLGEIHGPDGARRYVERMRAELDAAEAATRPLAS